MEYFEYNFFFTEKFSAISSTMPKTHFFLILNFEGFVNIKLLKMFAIVLLFMKNVS